MATPPNTPRLALGTLLSSKRIVIWDESVQKETVLRMLAGVVGTDDGIPHPETLFSDIMKREEQGSTFFNEGVAFPHVRVSDLASPIVALGITREGVSGVATEKPVELVFLIISPVEVPEVQVQVLGLVSRAAQNRHLFQSLKSAKKPEEALEAIRVWEMPEE
jgi:mannitol/fructose-specific phosphotransferase system IIA component (Ntr-type)